MSLLDKTQYARTQRWYEFYNSGKDLKSLPYHLSWYVMFTKLISDPKFKITDDKLKDIIKKNKHIKIFPLPTYVMNAFMMTPANDLKVVFIGQDPYFNYEILESKYVPLAMGLSFSVPHGVAIPSSLNNIYDNAIKYKHMKKKPLSGNLWYWAVQGCLLLNTALTVEDGSKESHIKLWDWFTNYVIRYISDNMNNIVFVLWGKYAYGKINLIDIKKHYAIVSSHPSGLSANKPMLHYPAFMNEDHFGKINKYLISKGKTPIMWY